MATYPPSVTNLPARDIDNTRPTDERKISYEEFFDWAPESRIAEWVDGEIIMPSPPRFGHQDISDFLTAVMRIYTQVFDLGQVISAPFQVKPGPGFPGREPDILFVAAPHRLDESTARLERPPEVAVEIISRESVRRDRGEKYLEYADAGVHEYWLIDGRREVAEFYRLDDTRHYKTVFAEREGVYHSEAISGFALQVDWLWQVPRPRPELAVLEMTGADYIRDVLLAATRILPVDEVARVLPDLLVALPVDNLASTMAMIGQSLSPADRKKLRDALR
ncbi:MAG: Uma2 family endonuclease [Chloroflexi bacterium]|nr:Uma2 family endonuclease [Chloroflexota bacterium]